MANKDDINNLSRALDRTEVVLIEREKRLVNAETWIRSIMALVIAQFVLILGLIWKIFTKK